MTDSLRDLVFASLNNARINGYHFSEWAPWEVALDLLERDADLEAHAIEDVLPHVAAWLEHEGPRS